MCWPLRSWIDFGRMQHMNVIRRRFVGWNNSEMFSILIRESDLFQQAVEDVWEGRESACALGIPGMVVCFCMTDKAQLRTGLENDLNQKTAVFECHAISLRVFFHITRYGPIKELA